MSTHVGVVATPVTTPRRAWWALAVLMLPVLLIAIDNTVLAFALPMIAEEFRPAASTQLWIVDARPCVRRDGNDTAHRATPLPRA